MKILVTGMPGVLASAFVPRALKHHEVLATDRRSLDVTNWLEVRDFVVLYKPDVILNCAGIVRGRHMRPSDYILVNSYAPHLLSDACNKTKVIQLSTDCVFNGYDNFDRLYYEDDIPSPPDLYARTKLAGELGEPHLTIRTSFVGFGERGLLAWLMKQKDTVDGYTFNRWNGLTAPALSDVILRLIELDVDGLIHISSDATTKYYLLLRLAQVLKLRVTVIPKTSVDGTFINRCLGSRRKDIIKEIKIPDLDSMIEAMVHDYDRYTSRSLSI
jgi:dTDP-4-dehydrorhamnose reductase